MSPTETKNAPANGKPEVAAQAVDKQKQNFDALKAAVERAGKKFQDKGKNGKTHVVTVNGTTVTIGAGGGFNIPDVSTYPKADLQTMVAADELFAKQNARKQRLADEKANAEKLAKDKTAKAA